MGRRERGRPPGALGVPAGTRLGLARDARVRSAQVPVPMRQVGERSREEREPVRDQPVRERGEHRVGGRHAGERQGGGQPGLDEAQAAGRDRDHAEHRGGDVRQQDQRGPRLRAHRRQRGQQRQVVQEPVPPRRDQREPPARAERAPDRVPLADELLGRAGLGRPVLVHPVLDALDHHADPSQRPVGGEQDGADGDRQDEQGRAEPCRLDEPARRRRAEHDRGEREDRQREQRRGADERGRGEPGADRGGVESRSHEQPELDRGTGRRAARHDPAERVPGDLRRRDREPLAGAERETLQRPRAREARDLGQEHHDEPGRVDRQQVRPRGEDLQQRRPQHVQREQREQQEDRPDDDASPVRRVRRDAPGQRDDGGGVGSIPKSVDRERGTSGTSGDGSDPMEPLVAVTGLFLP